MIYTAIATQGSVPQHLAFAQRNISGLTQSGLSAVPLYGKSLVSQLAYDGYKNNISSFLQATAIGKKVPCYERHAEIPDTYVPEVPLPFSKVMFRLAKKNPAPAYLSKVATGLEKFGFEKHESGRGEQMYSVSEGTFKLFRKDLPEVCQATCPTPDGYCTVESAKAATILHQAIDLFLRVNSYPYTRTLDGSDKLDGSQAIQYELKIRGSALRGEERDRKKARMDIADSREKNEDGTVKDIDMEEEPEVELTHAAEVFSEVLVAKPSPLPSSNNYGSPRSVPMLPGLCFPYFHGMISGDPKFIRTSVISMLFKNLGSESTSARDAYLEFKKAIGTFAYTPAGLVYQHILKGMELALDTQTQLYLLIDAGQYLGFCLLGGLFHILHNGSWIGPKSEDDLQAEVCSLVTHESQLDLLLEAMNGYPDWSSGKADGKISVTRDEIATPLGLCNALAKLNLEKCSETDYDTITRGIERLSFQTRHKGVGVESIVWAVEMMTTKIDEPLPKDLPVYVPTSNFHLLRRREFLVLSAFGSRTFSFISSGGVEYKIPTPETKDMMSEIDPDTRKKVLPLIVVSIKPPTQALQDWDTMMNKGVIKFDKNERAKGSRCYVYHNLQRDTLWACIKDHVATTRKKNGPPAPKKRKTEEAFGSRAEEIDDFQWG